MHRCLAEPRGPSVLRDRVVRKRMAKLQQRVSNGLDFRIVVVPLALPPSAKPDDSAAMRTKRVHQRVNNFANGAASSTNVPTQVQVSAAKAVLRFSVKENHYISVLVAPPPESCACMSLQSGEL